MAQRRQSRRDFGSPEQLKSGNWRARFTHPKTGERIKAPMTYTNKTDAQVWLDTQRADLERGTWQDHRTVTPTLHDYARQVIESKPKPKTVEGDLQSWNTHIAPFIGSVRVADLTVSQVNAWHSERQLKGVGKRALSKAYAVLRNVMACAVREELRQTNPCRIVGAGSTQSPERPHLSRDQVQLLADTIEPRYRALVLTLAYCLLRKGEATALRRSDFHIDLRTGQWYVSVTRKVQGMPGGGWRYGTPKTSAGVRRVPVPQFLEPILRSHLDTYVEPGQDSLVFTSSQGSPAYESGSRAIAKTLKVLGLEHINEVKVHTHDLRHTGATWLVQRGVSIPDLQRMLGDASPHAAMRYTHANSDMSHLADHLHDVHQSATA